MNFRNRTNCRASILMALFVFTYLQFDFSSVATACQADEGFALAASKAMINTAKNEVSKSEQVRTPDYVQVNRLSQPRQAYVKLQSDDLVDAQIFLDLVQGNATQIQTTLAQLERNWDNSYVPMILEVIRFVPQRARLPFFSVMQTKTGQQQLGTDLDSWRQWYWQQKHNPHPQYAEFMSKLYQRMDPRFTEYFVKTKDAQIRLDEIRWGGVLRDGIPPLKNPKMLEADQARYLSDTDVVFGIELNGDARCYPKRILAWHEMFKDTIGGESICGVY